jgi:hypothetical protein
MLQEKSTRSLEKLPGAASRTVVFAWWRVYVYISVERLRLLVASGVMCDQAKPMHSLNT